MKKRIKYEKFDKKYMKIIRISKNIKIPFAFTKATNGIIIS
jgi:hypothetical protein